MLTWYKQTQINPHELVAGVLLYHSTHCSCVTLSLTSHYLTCLTNFIQLDFQLRQSSQQNLLTREFVVFKLRCKSFLCCNKLPTVETSLLTHMSLLFACNAEVSYEHISFLTFSVVSFASSLFEIKHISFSMLYQKTLITEVD